MDTVPTPWLGGIALLWLDVFRLGGGYGHGRGASSGYASSGPEGLCVENARW